MAMLLFLKIVAKSKQLMEFVISMERITRFEVMDCCGRKCYVVIIVVAVSLKGVALVDLLRHHRHRYFSCLNYWLHAKDYSRRRHAIVGVKQRYLVNSNINLEASDANVHSKVDAVVDDGLVAISTITVRTPFKTPPLLSVWFFESYLWIRTNSWGQMR